MPRSFGSVFSNGSGSQECKPSSKRFTLFLQFGCVVVPDPKPVQRQGAGRHGNEESDRNIVARVECPDGLLRTLKHK